MTSPFIWLPNTAFVLMSTELESVASGSVAASSATATGEVAGLFTPATAYGSYELATIAWMVGNPGYASAFGLGAVLSGWFLQGTTALFPSQTVAPNKAPNFSFAPPLTTLAAGTVLTCDDVKLPSWPFYVLIQNNLGVTMASGATTAPNLTCLPYSDSY